MTLDRGSGGGSTIPPTPSGSGTITELTSEDHSVAITDPEGPVTDLSVSGGGGVASLSGAGVENSPGILDQSGGMSIDDTEGDGFDVTTNGGVSFIENGQNGIGISILGIGEPLQLFGQGVAQTYISIGALASGYVHVSELEYPVVVAAGVNDTFTYTPIATGTPDVFTVAPGSYADVADLAAALNAATDSSDTRFDFGDGCGFVAGGVVVFVEMNAGDTLTPGPTDILVATLGWDNPSTATAQSDTLQLFGSGGAMQQTITGPLSTVVDPAAKAVLTSLLAALGASSGYGLVLDGTT